MTDRLKNFPFVILFVAYLGYLGYELYVFHYSAEGEVEMHKTQMTAAQNEVETLKKKLVEGNKFVKSLEVKKAELQAQVQKLSEYQGTLSDGLDVPSMIKLLVTEARKLDIKVNKIEPGQKSQKEFYLEQEFKLDLSGTFQQVVLFAQRVAQLQRILRIEAYSLQPVQNGPGVKIGSALNAQLSVRAYQYTLSKEDHITVGGAL